ncbi:MAG: zinc dependent phospholipase [Firmicutes bacterium]|nr:zinc dependent phospholipase [Bacillota bacterium]
MNLRGVRIALSVGGSVKLLLAPAGIFQGLLDRPGVTHQFCNRQAVDILRNDGFVLTANFFENYLSELNAGVCWADEGWKNVSHYFDAGTRKGLWRFSTAVDDFRDYFGRSLQLARRSNWRKAVFFLGAAAHLVQDLCVPHHARGKLFAGHQQYEAWVEENYTKFAVNGAGLYNDKRHAHYLMVENANVAAEFLNWVEPGTSMQAYNEATAILLERAQRTTAGLFLQFYNMVAAVARVA